MPNQTPKIVGDKKSAVIEANAVRRVGIPVPNTQDEVEDPRTIIKQGLLVVLCFFGTIVLWMIFGEISGAVIAPGKIKIETERKTVQHLEGGIVESLLVQEGDTVVEGQTLLILKSVQVDASASLLHKQLVAQMAMYERASVEKTMGNTLEWSPELIVLAGGYDSETLKGEHTIFESRRDAIQGQFSLLKAQISQLDTRVSGLRDQIAAEDRIIATLQEELGAKRKLFEQHYLEKSQILELERNLASHEGNRGQLRQSVAESRERVAEVKLRMEDIKHQFIANATSEYGRLQTEIAQTQERMRPYSDAQERLQVTAPVSGRVVDLKVHSNGGVVRAGEPLMDIVPEDNPLIAETQVPVNKITEVYVGQEAKVQLDAFDSRLVPQIPGKVIYISADRFEERTFNGMMPYYLCHVTIDPESLEKEEAWLSPGMPVTVFITTKKRSVLSYFIEPLKKNWDRALRD